MRYFYLSFTILLWFVFFAVKIQAQTDVSPLTIYDKGSKALEFEHFPSRLHTFIWRNWAVVPVQRLATVLETSIENINKIAASMGLPPQKDILPIWESPQGYITVLRRNWHLLPFSQLLVLLDQTPEQLAESLQEDDFLYIKLGSVKPQCEPLRYAEPAEEQNKRAAEIAEWVSGTLSSEWNGYELPEEPRFHFLKTFFPDKPAAPFPTRNVQDIQAEQSPFELRFLSSYFATFGDPLLDPEVKSYPDELLRQLSQHGVNGIWLHTVLRTLSPPSELFPEFGKDYEIRLKSLKTLVNRADRYGIKVYLYMNEPRTMPNSFFAGERAKLAGVPYGTHAALCTSTPEVRQWLSDSLTNLFKNVPGLGGIFSITASENHTNCTSHYQKDKCPRCKNRSVADIIAELNRTFADAIHSVDPNAKMIAWDWGWQDDVAAEIIEALPDSCWLQSVSEWSLPIERGGIKSNVGEYSISSVGPGPRAMKHWELAQKRGLKTVAKVQFNVTWELAAVPYIPVSDLIAEHVSNLSGSGVNGLMLGWSLGGYPSPNLEIAQAFQSPPSQKQTPEEAKKRQNEVLDRIARKYYGAGTDEARQAWKEFSTGYREYPYHIGLCYSGPQHWGPATLVFPKRTNYGATMVGIPYDDVKTWCAVYPPEVAAAQFHKTAEHFGNGIELLQKATEKAPAQYSKENQDALNFSRAAQLHFSAAANMIEFYTLRNKYLDETDSTKKKELAEEMKRILNREINAAARMYQWTKSDSRIGYESSNHYWYIPDDIAEAVISIKHFLKTL